MIKTIGMLAILVAAASCSKDDSRATSGASVAPAPTVTAARPSLGNVMVQVARRFEICGKAAVAKRFELAAFEAGELAELFESEVLDAELPKEGPTAHIPALARGFLATSAPELESAAKAGDPRAFTLAFERAATACNGCHAASAKGFIQVPLVPGRDVPELAPTSGSSVPPASAAPR
jgi:hypothetical protein